ncbi:MAG: thioredoxin family protein [Chitinophagales bacterium]
MRKIFLVLIAATFLSSAGFSQGINFRPISLQEAITVSATENKPVFFMAYQGTCGHCEKMLHEIFPDTALSNFYNKNYICIKEDLIDQEKAKAYVRKFYITSFPTFIILNNKGETLYQFVGEFKVSEFIKQGTLALNPDNQLPHVKIAFDNNPADSTACYNYLLVLSRGRLSTQPVANMYFNANNKTLEFTNSNWKIFSMSVSDMESEIFKYVLAHQKEFGDVVTPKKVERKIFLTATYNLQSAVNANDTINYFRNRKSAEQLHIYLVDSVIFMNDLNLFEKNKQWNRYMATAITGAEKYVWTDANMLRRITDVFLNHDTENEMIQKIIPVGVRCAELKPEYYNFLAAAKVFLRAGDKANANLYAQKAKEIGEKNQMNLSEANLIITQSSR